MQAAISQVVTFCTNPFGGNPAYVLSVETFPSEAVLKNVVALLDADVLAVIESVKSISPGLRFFTESGEHPGAGHATLAAAHVALQQRQNLTFQLANGGSRDVRRCERGIAVDWPVMPYTAAEQGDRIAHALGAAPLECQVSSFGNIAIFRNEAEIAALVPDMDLVAQLDRTALIATAPGQSSDIVVRVFAPAAGLPEDPVCGTAHRIITPYWSNQLDKSVLHSRHLSSRGGDLWCEFDGQRVSIAGETVNTILGTMTFPTQM